MMFPKEETPEHDKLVMECLQRNNLKRIFDLIFDPQGVDPLVYGYERDQEVWICQSRKPWCTRDGEKAFFREKPATCTNCRYFNRSSKENPVPDDVKKDIVTLLGYFPKLAGYPKYEVEVVVENPKTGYLIGYADILVTYPIIYELEVIKGSFPSGSYFTIGFLEHRDLEKVVIEVKPKIGNIFEVLRQIKTYMKFLDVNIGVIATRTRDLSKEVVELLRREKVFLATF